MSKALKALDKKTSDLLTELGLTFHDCARFHVLGKCSDPKCTRNHTATNLSDQKVQQALQLLKDACQALDNPPDS